MKFLIIGLTLAIATAACTVQERTTVQPAAGCSDHHHLQHAGHGQHHHGDHAGRPGRDDHRLYALNGQAAALAARAGAVRLG